VNRVYVVAEGPTEELFLSEILAPTLFPLQVYLQPIVLGPSGHRGGHVSYARVRRDILAYLKQDRQACCSTMLDFYGLGKGFPGQPLPADLSGREQAARIERAMAADIGGEVPDLRPDVRFIPYLQLHEYEGLLFSDPAAFATSIGQKHLAQRFQEIRNEFTTPEDINDDPNTAPSKRVLGLYASYRKVLGGTIAAKAIGIDRMRQECPHFRDWVERLEALAAI
jgi:hypothetical protein